MLVLLFIAKVIDQTLSTSKTIFIQRNHGLLAAVMLSLSDLIYFTIIKNVVVADSIIPMIVTAVASGVGCWLTVGLNNHFSKDRLYVNVLLCDDKNAVKKLAEYLMTYGITCVVNDGYTKELDGKTLSLTAYAETKDQSKIIDDYVEANSNLFKRIIKK